VVGRKEPQGSNEVVLAQTVKRRSTCKTRESGRPKSVLLATETPTENRTLTQNCDLAFGQSQKERPNMAKIQFFVLKRP